MAGGADEGDRGDRTRKRSYLATALAVLGVIQLYNIVAHHQALLDLSQSLKLLADWWRYALAETFSFLRIDLPPLARELLTLLLLAGSAANLAFKKKRGRFLVTEMVRGAFTRRPGYDFDDFLSPDVDQGYFGFLWLVLILTMFGTVFFIVASSPSWFIKASLAMILGVFLVFLAHWLNVRLLRRLFVLMTLPLLFVILWVLATASYYRPIFRSLRYLVLLLALDLAARYVIDPLLPSISVIPEPPPQSAGR